MVEPLGLGSGVHDLKLGSSFDQGSGVGFHSIRYDFKPASVDTKKMASLNIEEGKSVTVTVPHMAGSGTTHTVYKGNKRPIQKECVLIIDHQTGEITLEKLSNTIQLKKTSCQDALKKTTSGNDSGRIRFEESSRSSDISELERRIGAKLDIHDKAPKHQKCHHSKTKHTSSKRHKSNCASSSPNNIVNEKEKFCLDSLSKSRHSKTKHSFKKKRMSKHKVPDNTRLTCILLSDDSDGLPDLDFSPGDVTSSPPSHGEQVSKVPPSSVGPSTNTASSKVACSLILIGDDSNELPDIEMTETEKTGGDLTEMKKSMKLTNISGIKGPSCPTVKTECPDVSSKTHQEEKVLVNSSSTSSRASPILKGQRVRKVKCKIGCTKLENQNDTQFGHKAQEEQKPRLSQKSSTKSQNPSPANQIDVVQFAETVKKDILTFLQGHKLEVARRPYVSSAFTLSEFQHSHKTLYDRALKRANLPEHSLNALIKFICREYREFLISSEQLLAHVQRLEDVCDFILDRMEQGQKDVNNRRHTALK